MMVDKEFNVKLNMDLEETTKQLEKYMAVLYGFLGLMRRMGLPEEVSQAMAQIQKLIATTQMLIVTMRALETTTTYGQIMFGISAIGTIITLADVS